MFFKKKKHPFSQSEIDLIETHLKKAELTSSCELRIFMEQDCFFEEPLERANEVFAALQMQATQERNALLLYIATKSKKFAILGDEAIYEKAGGASFWETAATGFVKDVKTIDLTRAIVNCIDTLSIPMQEHFPANAFSNDNELADEIVFGK
jgi:hypothetical protein